ncbi:DUF4931 domain-containing protein [Enterococcus gallinarum]|uniref:DUF4931 domain-containing protein n=1 Tax=Enterococcus gallinarum TaxID=1353 RepID=A0AAE4L2G8_ENTGA|nr:MULTISPECIES: DUF4931 domain-containing protein [Enterococcus]MDN3168420.1 DUF4931 domain-containing protein [Enterococcus faecalis]MDT2681203.1 DUF4931 domain-containing protein [Enterococcus gallinarum]MDT2692015.1 DUF4931 domain-containing protein [Enterococcus gallinarum]HAQ1357583.1 DUF4931 domain-containing protein [Enterococcus faecium]HAQ4474950.1 DUF4931 domain-containing protein [Enterococcus faecium]
MEGCESYNLFFFEKEGKYIVKLFPRFIVSPYFVGYKLPHRIFLKSIRFY